MLDTVPPEILAHIALHVALPDLAPPVPLLCTSRAIHATLAPQNNPRLYARLFRSAFDTRAAERRTARLLPPPPVPIRLDSLESEASASTSTVASSSTPQPSASDDESDEDSPREVKRRRRNHERRKRDGERLTAVQLTAELKRRIRALSRLGRQIEAEDLSDLRDDDLWVVYLMMIENDKLNLAHLTTTGPASIDLFRFLQLYHEQHLLAAAIRPGYPEETVGRALAMWISWLMTAVDRPEPESQEERDEHLFVLRPYVFAAQQYELCFGPWTIPDLPLTTPFVQQEENNPFVQDLSPKSRKQTIEYYGRQIELSHPMLSHAAILRFFANPENLDDESSEGVASAGSVPAPDAAVSGTVNSTPASSTPHTPAASGSDPGPYSDPTMPSVGRRLGPTEIMEHRPIIHSSLAHDRDFARLLKCYDPSSCRGMNRGAWRGSWNGCWEGNFSFFDFDAFREMLAGHSRALYEGPFGEQKQVWKMTETWVRPIRPAEDTEKAAKPAVKKGKKAAKNGGLPLRGPITNAGFPTARPASMPKANLESPSAEAATLKETIRQQVEAIEGYEQVPEDELDEMFDGPDGTLDGLGAERNGLEMLLTGTGHSAWGRFLMKGRVRSWDGMVSLVKEYAPDSRGKWIYRGYILSGDVFVGRWRDTFTPEAFVGYEGTFILNRRST